jgi:hypothetical protein
LAKPGKGRRRYRLRRGNRTIATVYFTICARNYLAYALSLAESLRRNAGDPPFFICLADDEKGTEALGSLIIPLSRLNLPQIDRMRFQYSVTEFSTAIKPACFLHLLQDRGFDAAIYLDPDTYVFSPLSEVDRQLASGATCVLTPHILEPLEDKASPGEIDILRSGVFNLGFATFTRAPEAISFLNWWARHLETDCFIDLERGLFVDQKFVDFAPAFLPDLHILRHPGFNVAYWNLSHRPIGRSAQGIWTAGNAPLVFFHFSGVIPGDKTVFSRHQDRISMQTVGPAASLVLDYLGQLEENGQANWSAIPYAYCRFDNGELIAGPMRRAWKPGSGVTGPFAHPQTDWWDAPSPDVDQDTGAPFTRLMYALHQSRTDLRAAFPLSVQSGRRAFLDWFMVHGIREYQIASARTSRIGRLTARLRLVLKRLFSRG